MKEEKINVVLVEDDLALGSLMSELLILSDFEVKWFKNGTNVMSYLERKTPDVIVSDYMMPILNGEELYLLIRKQEKFKTIPFIIITANVEEGVKYRQLKNGVNDFITKPFKVKELIYKIKNVIELKRNLEKKFRPDAFSKVTIKLSERDFITSLDTILASKLKTQVDIDDLCKQLFLSRSTLDKKIRVKTNKNISKYIREFKLEYAIKLLDLGEKNIQYLADETGFNSISYFSTSFKLYKNVTPTNYIKSIHTENSF